ncbi:MAG: type 11 methyltransferase [Candidatus Peregrinibacteria bacterium Gr01-1014_25]|nr:MAG: type 11 methyltransferase [Candidatus Peregrinibacteria bacterium Gr01-1014_25]
MKLNFFDTASTARPGDARREAIRNVGEPTFTEDHRAFGYDYFDNPDLGVGYGGYAYDGRFAEPVRKAIAHYGLKPGDRVLEIGCAKGYLLVEFLKQGMNVVGIDGSAYAIENAHPDVKAYLQRGDFRSLPFPDKSFDLVIAKDTLEHNPEPAVRATIAECMRVTKGPTFFQLCVGRTPAEIAAMPKWDQSYTMNHTPEWWDRFFDEVGYRGDLHYKVLVPEGECVS